MTNKTKRILGTICFSCCEPPKFPWTENMSVRKGKHPKLGEKVELNGACEGCPIAAIRGDGAPISKGQPGFFGLVPGLDCQDNLDSLDTWYPCVECERATVADDEIRLNDLEYCSLNCPAKEIRDCLEEQEAEARMS